MSTNRMRGRLGGRWLPLRALLTFLLLPVILLAGPMASGAHAVSNYSAKVSAVLFWDDTVWGPSDDVGCAIAGYWETFDTGVVRLHWDGGGCNVGYAVHGYGIDSGTVTLTVNGPGCAPDLAAGTLNVLDDGVPEGADWVLDDNHNAIVGTSGTLGSCSIDEVCASIEVDLGYHPDDVQGAETCSPLALGTPDGVPSVSVCPVNAMQPTAVTASSTGTGSSGSYSWSVTMQSTGVASIRVLAWMTTGSGTNWYGDISKSKIGAGAETFTGGGSGSFGGTGPLTMLGIQVVVTNTWTTGAPNSEPYGVATPNPWDRKTLRNGGNDNHMGGASWPARCSWYFGTKIASTASDTYDEPWAPLGGTPPTSGEDEPADPVGNAPDEGACGGFSLTNPLTWGDAGFCAIVRVLMQAISVLGQIVAGLVTIADAILGLAESIVNALTTLFETLWIPSPDFFSNAFDDLSTDLERPKVTAWTDAFEGAFNDDKLGGDMPISFVGDRASLVPSGTGCQGPGIQWDMFDDMGLPGTLYPLNSCSGIMSQVAAATKLILTGLIGIASLIKCIGIIAAALGFTKDTPSLQPDSRGV